MKRLVQPPPVEIDCENEHCGRCEFRSFGYARSPYCGIYKIELSVNGDGSLVRSDSCKNYEVKPKQEQNELSGLEMLLGGHHDV